MKISIEQAIEMAKKGEELKGVVIEDLGDTQVSVRDALVLAQKGIVIPEQHVYYDDNDIQYDPDFDDIDWSKEPIKLSFEEKAKLKEAFDREKKKTEHSSDSLILKLDIEDQQVRTWADAHHDELEHILEGLVVDLYKARKILRE